MAKSKSAKGKKPVQKSVAAPEKDIFKLRSDYEISQEEEERVHVLRKGVICDTEPRGHSTPQGRSPLEIVVDASEGFIPLWACNMTLHWRFRERSLLQFVDPEGVKDYVRTLLGEALMAWGTAVPVRFREDDDVWDFEIVVRSADDCTPSGCVLASAFFPDAGRHELVIYPRMFEQDHQEQVETLVHEIGHVFGLRHFFANISETEFPSEIFGTHDKFSIMNYGEMSTLTDADKDDLRKLYQLVWAGAITQLNGTPIRLVKPFNTLVAGPDGTVVLQPAAAAAMQQARITTFVTSK